MEKHFKILKEKGLLNQDGSPKMDELNQLLEADGVKQTTKKEVMPSWEQFIESIKIDAVEDAKPEDQTARKKLEKHKITARIKPDDAKAKRVLRGRKYRRAGLLIGLERAEYQITNKQLEQLKKDKHLEIIEL